MKMQNIGVLKAPKKKHWTPSDIDNAIIRMRRFMSSKASKKARWKKSATRFYKRLDAELD